MDKWRKVRNSYTDMCMPSVFITIPPLVKFRKPNDCVEYIDGKVLVIKVTVTTPQPINEKRVKYNVTQNYKMYNSIIIIEEYNRTKNGIVYSVEIYSTIPQPTLNEINNKLLMINNIFNDEIECLNI